MLIALLLAFLLVLALGALARAVWFVSALWSAIPDSNADFGWLDV